MIIDLIKIRDLEEQGLVSVRSSENGELNIVNYTPIVQYDRLWTPLLKQCRGLIINNSGNIVARPFPKFFNLEEHDDNDLPTDKDFEIYEKLDGSLGILYWDNDWKIATRGSFISDQAMKATEMLHSKYSDYLGVFDRDKTYLFEIIYPDNRIVVDYGETEGLYLLAVLYTNKLKEADPYSIDFPDIVQSYSGVKDFNKLKALNMDNKEGYVIRYPHNNFRLKIKFEDYVRMHRVVTNVSSYSLWEILKEGTFDDFKEILEKVPDEFYDWVHAKEEELTSTYNKIYKTSTEQFKENVDRFDNRKDFALWAQKQPYPSVLFGLLDEKDVSDRIWKMIKPEYEKPFNNENT